MHTSLTALARSRSAWVSLLVLAAACSRAEEKPGGAGPEDAAEVPASDDDAFSHEAMLGIMSPAEADPDAVRGLRVHEEGAAFEGYTLIEPLNSRAIHLLDMDGEVVHTWPTDSSPGGWCYLQDDGTLLRGGREDEDPQFRGGGIGGRIQRLAPDGEVLWLYEFADRDRHQHHDIEPLPNGNVLAIAWERKPAAEAVARGRDPRGVGAVGLWPDAVFEIRPTPPRGGEIVWEWHAWDHLVQDRDPAKPNHGALADHPGRIDINAAFEAPDELSEEERREQEELEKQMAAIGYTGGDDEEEPEPEEPEEEGNPWDRAGDWMHTNAVDYHPGLDLIVLSSPELCEIFVIDHSTTTAEAATSRGGRYGKGGDLLWRWGNARNYGIGGEAEQRLFYQHDPSWLPGDEARLLVFNNGGRRQDGSGWSAVLELELPFDVARGFAREAGAAFGPTEPAWSYSDPATFYSAFISGAQRQPNGNTLICSGAPGHLLEVTREGRVVWDYMNTHGGEVIPPEHAGRAPPLSLYRVARYAPDHPGIRALLR